MPPALPVEMAAPDSRKNSSVFVEFEPNYRNDMKPAKKAIVEEEDPWKITELGDFGKPWVELTSGEKTKRVVSGIAKGVAVLILLYFFVCSLDLLSLGFRLVGGRTTGEIFRQNDILQNPIVGVMIGILTTVLVQSSSTSTSIIVSMVASDFLDVKQAIPIIMGANIGTSITNTIVSLTQVGDRNQFRRAFAGATVHDMFNWLTVITLLIVEVTTNYLYHVTTAIMDGLAPETSKGGDVELLGKITKPLVNLIVQLDKKVLECWSTQGCETNSTLLKEYCGTVPKSNSRMGDVLDALMELGKDSVFIAASTEATTTEAPEPKKCDFLFATFGLSDAASGGIVLVCSLIILCTCLILIVKVLQSVLKGQIATIIKKTLNAKIPYVPWLTGYIAILVGAGMTFLVQSSSVFTSALTPLVGLGVISVERVYPLTLGSNIGTTTTALLAALATEGSSFRHAMQIALCHLFFNVTGILLFYPISFMRFPIPMAKFLGDTTAKYRWFAIVYMILMFVFLPLITMGLSFAGTPFVVVFAALIVFIFAFVGIVNLIRQKKPEILPERLKSWKWLPLPLRSLAPYDKLITNWPCCRRFKAKDEGGEEDNAGFESDENGFAANRGNLTMVSIDENGKPRRSNDGGITNSGFVE